ncbi:tripartite tricarboxylate transporter substrate binding protein [Bradyrhizobium sp.]|uniref:Bug family tripartite tricarboxylate transporter substrate binding protein n=1 Tax=Bradyrhizobium sp. TaxID=376 RepID=UPI00263457F6|nr:tripartite tricarboxylate transporter substrate binding protein [Bradyrhizobium sp.]
MSDYNGPLPSRRQFLKTAGVVAGAAAAPIFTPKQALAAGYPERPVRIVVPFAPAGPTDIMARILGDSLGEALGGNVIVENRPGASGNIGIGYVAHAEADGYTLLVVSSAYVVNPSLFAKVPYDPFKDFEPITELGTTPNMIVVSPKLGINSIAELFARAKAKPDELNYASPGAGTTPHLSAELLKIVGHVQITHVPFSGAAPAIQALLAGTTQMAVTALPAALPFVESGELTALALTGAHRWVDLPNVPTMVELGYKDFVAETAQFFLAPARTPAAIVATLAAKSIDVLKKPAVIAKLRDNGYEVATSGPEGLRKYVKSEVPRWHDIIAKAGIKPV